MALGCFPLFPIRSVSTMPTHDRAGMAEHLGVTNESYGFSQGIDWRSGLAGHLRRRCWISSYFRGVSITGQRCPAPTPHRQQIREE
jgi:hypothetical protein